MLVWRRGRGHLTNNDIAHAMSDDGGRTWRTIAGQYLGREIRHDSRTTVFDTEDEGFGVVNQGGAVLDANGNPWAAFERRLDGERTLLLVHFDGGRWRSDERQWSLGGRPALARDPSGTVWVLGRRGGAIEAIEADGPGRVRRFRGARLPSGWNVSLDSVSMENGGVVRTLVPDDREPRVIELFDR